MSKAYTKVLKEVKKKLNRGYSLCFQECEYHYEDEYIEYGYRFMWRDRDNKLIAHRGQARIPSIEILEELVNKAKEEGWAIK